MKQLKQYAYFSERPAQSCLWMKDTSLPGGLGASGHHTHITLVFIGALTAAPCSITGEMGYRHHSAIVAPSFQMSRFSLALVLKAASKQV